MTGGSFRAPLFTITWPTGEFGGMGLEGAVKLGYRKDEPEEAAREWSWHGVWEYNPKTTRI